MKDKIKQYLDQLNERERQMVYVAAVVVVVFLPYQLIWAPFMNSINTLHEKVEQQEKDLLWMQSKVPEIRQLGSSTTRSKTGDRSIYGVIETTARKKFGGDIRVQQEGKQGIRVSIKNAGFDDLVIWLDELHLKQNIYVKEFKVDRESGVGRVKASILIED